MSKRWVIVRNHSYENVFHLQPHFLANYTRFHMKGFARRLVLRKRHRETGKLSTVLYNLLADSRLDCWNGNEASLRENDIKKPQQLSQQDKQELFGPMATSRWRLFVPGGCTPLLGLYGDVPLNRVWFSGLAVLNRVYNLTCLCPKQGQLS